jgi:hypothetical protein
VGVQREELTPLFFPPLFSTSFSGGIRMIKVKLSDVEFQNILRVYRGVFVERDELDKYIENAEEVFKYFENEIIVGAILARDAVYFITLSHEVPYVTLTVWTAKIE